VNFNSGLTWEHSGVVQELPGAVEQESPECSKSAPGFMRSTQELSGALRSTRSG